MKPIMKCTCEGSRLRAPYENLMINILRLNHPEASPTPALGLWKNCLPQNQFLVPRRLGTTGLEPTGNAIHFP